MATDFYGGISEGISIPKKMISIAKILALK